MTDSQHTPESYAHMFGHRFTSEDHAYQQYVHRPADTPPTVDDWRGRGGGNQRGRDNRYQGGRGGWGRTGGGSQRHGEGWRAEHRGQQWQDRERPWGHSSGSGPPGSYHRLHPHHH